MAHALNSDPKVQAAIAETSQQYITALGPHAVRALKKVLDNIIQLIAITAGHSGLCSSALRPPNPL
jgi:hypothetical protein